MSSQGSTSRRRATELSFRGAVMVFLVFLEVLEMSSEVVGPGPNTREIKSLRVDPGPRACALPPDAGCMLPFGLFVVCVGGFPPGAPSWRCPQSSLFLFYKIQLSTGSRWYRCDSARRRGGTRRKAESVGSPPLISPYVRRCCLSTLLLPPVGVRAAPLDARLRVLRVVPLVPLRALIPEDRRVRFIRRACVGCR